MAVDLSFLNWNFQDAWLDSVQVDERFAEEAAAKAAFAEAPPEEITSSEIGQIKRRIANALNPGETVSQLRG